MLAEVRGTLSRIRELRTTLRELGAKLEESAEGNGEAAPAQRRFQGRIEEMQALAERITRVGIVLRDLDAGLIDFPSFRGDQEVFLCYHLGEDSIEFWHGLDDGIAGREPV